MMCDSYTPILFQVEWSMERGMDKMERRSLPTSTFMEQVPIEGAFTQTSSQLVEENWRERRSRSRGSPPPTNPPPPILKMWPRRKMMVPPVAAVLKPSLLSQSEVAVAMTTSEAALDPWSYAASPVLIIIFLLKIEALNPWSYFTSWWKK